MSESWRGAFVLAVLVTGCVLSVDPVISESAATFDPRLLGTWEELAGSDQAVVSRAAGNAYLIEYTSDGKVGRFEARLGRLGDRSVLDVWPAPRDSELQPYAVTLIGGHVMFAVDIGSNEIRVAMLERDTLRAALRAGQVSLTHSDAKDRLVLRGSTEELRSALASYISRSGALAEPNVWRHARGR